MTSCTSPPAQSSTLASKYNLFIPQADDLCQLDAFDRPSSASKCHVRDWLDLAVSSDACVHHTSPYDAGAIFAYADENIGKTTTQPLAYHFVYDHLANATLDSDDLQSMETESDDPSRAESIAMNAVWPQEVIIPKTIPEHAPVVMDPEVSHDTAVLGVDNGQMMTSEKTAGKFKRGSKRRRDDYAEERSTKRQ